MNLLPARSLLPLLALALVTILASTGPAKAQENPFFVTYDHHLEDRGDLEVSTFSMIGVPRGGQNAYFAPLGELEYGVTNWWTTSLYLEGQGTAGESGLFTGWSLENRFRPLRREHFINPVLYFEYENSNEASRVQKEIVGNSSELSESNSVAGSIHSHELEGKLILSSNVRHWNVSENLIVEKNLSENEGVEFGYAVGMARPLAVASSPNSANRCRWCRESLAGGVELYGGLGSTRGFGLRDTTHYLAPVVSWAVGSHTTLHFSPAIGLTSGSSPVLFRVGYTYEFEDFGPRMSSLFRRRN
jgi:hypothetical protein